MYFTLCGKQVDEKKLKEKIQTLQKDKSDALAKISELQKQVSYKISVIKYEKLVGKIVLVIIPHIFLKTEKLKENQKRSKETVSCTTKKMQALEVRKIRSFCLYLNSGSLIFHKISALSYAFLK